MNRTSRHLVAIATLLLSLCAAVAASAADYYDPPGRVARLSHMQGELSFSPAGENGWYDVHRNRPLVRGDRLWTDRDSRAELQVGSALIRMDEETSVEFLELNDRLVQVEVSEGTINLRVRRLYPGQEFEIATPQLAFVVNRVGDYRIDVNPRYDRTTIVVSQGAGVAYGDRDRFPLRAGDAVRFYDNDLRDYEVFRLPRLDDFDRYCSTRDLRYNVKAIYQFYLGAYDGNPANLNPLPPQESAQRWLDLIGGADKAVAAFNVNNMELLQAIIEACEEEKAPVMLRTFYRLTNGITERSWNGLRCRVPLPASTRSATPG